MTELATKGERQPAVSPTTRAAAAIQRLAEVFSPYVASTYSGGFFDSSCPSPAAARSALEAAKVDLPSMTRPATELEIREHMAALVGCFPAAKNDARIFARMLIGEVYDDQPSIGALAMACRQLRREQTFMPAIKEVLDALKAQEGRLRTATMAVEKLPAMIEAHEVQIAERRKRLAALPDKERA